MGKGLTDLFYSQKPQSESESSIRKCRSVKCSEDNDKENVGSAATGSKFNYELDKNILDRLSSPSYTYPSSISFRREKQIAYGKNTVDYDKYMRMVPKRDRKERMPRTPNKYKKLSRRQWDGLVKYWKQGIHATVAALEKAEMDFADNLVTTVNEEAWKKVKMSFDLSWAEEVEAEEVFCIRKRVDSCRSLCSDQV